MAYGMEQLRKAGAAIRSFDDAYSDKIAKMYPDTNAGIVAAAIGGGIPSTYPMPIDSGNSRDWRDTALAYGLPAVNAVPKYVLPAAGVTLAGQGLYDLTNQFGGAADQQEPSQLSL